jgi:hypothetical protein
MSMSTKSGRDAVGGIRRCHCKAAECCPGTVPFVSPLAIPLSCWRSSLERDSRKIVSSLKSKKEPNRSLKGLDLGAMLVRFMGLANSIDKAHLSLPSNIPECVE